MVYKYGQKRKSRFRSWVGRGPVILFALGIMSFSTYTAAVTDKVSAPGESDVLAFATTGSQPNIGGDTELNQQPQTNLDSTDQINSVDQLGSVQPSKCIVKSPTLSGFNNSISPEIKKLSEYEEACGGSFIKGSMLFVAMPANETEAINISSDTAIRLKEFAKFGLEPTIIMEPITSAGMINLKEFANGKYDNALNAFFTNLKNLGINDSTLGKVVPFPEANIPVWGNTNPQDVSACILKAVQIQKQHFPGSHASILLDSKSYPSGNSWEGGHYGGLLDYVNGIPKGLINSFGLQGYPWPDPEPQHNPTVFLSSSQAIEVAKALGASEIWFNSGTFNKGTAWTGKVFSLTPRERQNILNGIINEANKAKSQGFITSIMLFSEDKFNTPEGNDWSYWTTPAGPNSSEHTDVFRAFQNKAVSSGISVSVFDSY